MKTKSALQSKTIWGGIVLAVLSFLGFAEVDINEVFEALVTLIGFGLVLYGRIKAQLPVKLLKGGSANLLAVALIGTCMIGAVLTQTGCTAIERYSDWAEANPKASALLESAAHAAIIYAINDQAEKSDTVATHQEALKEAANAAFAEGATVADVARLIADEVFAIYPEDPETRAILLAGFDQALSDPAGSGIPANDQERVQIVLLRAELEIAFIVRPKT